MEPVTTIATALGLAKTAGEIGKKLFEVGKQVKDRETKQQIDDILDKIRELKQSACDLEDENRSLREKLRFKSDDYEFHTPFWYEKSKPEQAFCPKCFSQYILAPMGERGQGCNSGYRQCLVCQHPIDVSFNEPDSPSIPIRRGPRFRR